MTSHCCIDTPTYRGKQNYNSNSQQGYDEVIQLSQYIQLRVKAEYLGGDIPGFTCSPTWLVMHQCDMCIKYLAPSTPLACGFTHQYMSYYLAL